MFPLNADDPQIAVCSYVTRQNAMPTLVALLPQPEELDGDEQVRLSNQTISAAVWANVFLDGQRGIAASTAIFCNSIRPTKMY